MLNIKGTCYIIAVKKNLKSLKKIFNSIFELHDLSVIFLSTPELRVEHPPLLNVIF